MPKRRVVVVAIVVCSAALASRGALGCIVMDTEPICGELGGLDGFGSVTDEKALLATLADAKRALETGDRAPAFRVLATLQAAGFEGEGELERVRRDLLAAWRANGAGDPALEAYDALAAGDLERLRALAARHPDHAAATILLAQSLDDADDPLAARRALESFLAGHPHDLDALHALLELEWTEEHTARAHELAARWRSLAPHDVAARFHEFVTLATVAADPELDSRLTELARFVADAEQLLIGCSQLPVGRREQCTARAAGLVDFRNVPPRNVSRAAGWLMEAGELDRALALVELETRPRLRTALERRLALELADAGRCDEAIARAESSGNPGEEFFFSYLASIRSRCGDDSALRNQFLAALEGGDWNRAQRHAYSLPERSRDERIEAAVRAKLADTPRDARLWSMLSLFASGDPGRESSLLEEWSRTTGASRPVLLAAERATAEGRFTEADAAYVQAARRAENPETRERIALRRLDSALESGDRARIERLVAELEVDGDSVAALARAELAHFDGRDDEALAELRAIPDERGDWRAGSLREQIEARSTSDAEFVRGIREEMEESPERDILSIAAIQAWNADRIGLARKLHLRLLADDPDDAQTWADYASSEQLSGDPGAAEAAFRRALALRPDDVSSRMGLAEVLVENRDWWEALDLLTERELPPRGEIQALLELASEARRADELGVAWSALERVAALEPGSIDLEFERAELAAREGRASTAREAFAEIVERLAAGPEPPCAGSCDLALLAASARRYLASGDTAGEALAALANDR